MNADELARLEVAAKAAYRALDCRDYGRIDVRLSDGVFYVMDVNPNADISADASLAMAAGKAGYCYGRFGSRVLDFAAQRHPNRAGAGRDGGLKQSAIGIQRRRTFAYVFDGKSSTPIAGCA